MKKEVIELIDSLEESSVYGALADRLFEEFSKANSATSILAIKVEEPLILLNTLKSLLEKDLTKMDFHNVVSTLPTVPVAEYFI